MVVGLGNPGAEYARTRHNAGFEVVERLVRAWGCGWQAEGAFSARLARAEFAGRKVLLAQPQTYMNLSGTAVARVVGYYRVALHQLLVVVDDADLPLGELRLRGRGSAGGHHGLESVEQALGTREYGRLRLGIGRSGAARQIRGYVLGRFRKEEQALAEAMVDRAVRQIECWLGWGLEKAMNDFNGAEKLPEQRKAE